MWPFSPNRFSSLKGRLVYSAILPGLLACVLLSGGALWFVQNTLQQQQLEQQRGNLETLAELARPSLQQQDIKALEQLARSQLGLANIRSLTFLDHQARILTHIGGGLDVQPEAPHKKQALAAKVGEPYDWTLDGQRITWTWPVKDQHRQTIGWIRSSFSTDALNVILYRCLVFLLLALSIVLSVTVAVASYLFRRTTHGFNQIQQQLGAITQGRFDTPLQAGDNEELNALIDVLNQAIHSFATQQRELQENVNQSTQDLRETLETIEIQNIELDLARKEALHASKIKSEFLANTSHEIRTPLNGIIGFTRLLLKDCQDPQQLDYLQTIQQSSENLLGLINDILDLSKIEAGKLILDYESFNVRDLAEDTLQILAPSAHEKGLELASVIDANVPEYLFGDPSRIKQILTNLIGNAIKFSNSGSILVRMALEQQEGTSASIRCSVTDTGIGIHPNQLNKELFSAFSQASNNQLQKSGAGLGLAISKKLVDQMHGEIGINSEENVGSTFWFTLKLDVDTQTATRPQPNLTACRFLIADINRASRQSLSNVLTGWNARLSFSPGLEDVLPALTSNASLPQNEWFSAVILSIPVDTTDFSLDQLGPIVVEAQRFCPVILHAAHTFRHYLSKHIPDNALYLNKPLSRYKFAQTLQGIGLINTPPPAQVQATFPEKPMAVVHHSILVVDDNDANLKLLGTLLRGMGHQVVEASSGADALRLCQQQTFSMIFMDIRMPGMDGIETTRRIRMLNNANGQIPVIAVTAHAMTEQKQQLLLSGLDDYLSKPTYEDQLKQMISRWQQKKTATAETTSPTRCIDISLSLKLSNGKADLATDLLKMLLADLKNNKLAINAAFKEKDIVNALERVHKLLGACCYCGVPTLKIICQTMENQLHAKVLDIENLSKLNAAIDELLQWNEENSVEDLFI